MMVQVSRRHRMVKRLLRWLAGAAGGMVAAVGVYALLFLQAGEPHQIRSAFPAGIRTYSVHYPRGYDPLQDRRYPVVYSLDGEKFRHGALMAANARLLAALGLAPEVIIVAVHTGGQRARDYAPDAGAATFSRYLQQELMPEIDARYPTNGYRVISGHSYGGLYAVYALVEQPGLFDAHFAYVPSVFHSPTLLGSLESYLTAGQGREARLFLYGGLESENFWHGYEAALGMIKQHAPPSLTWHDGYFPLPHPLIMVPAQMAALGTLPRPSP